MGSSPEEQLAGFKDAATRSKRPLTRRYFAAANAASPEALAGHMLNYTGVPFVELKPSDITPEILNKIPERIARQYNAILFKIDEDGTKHLAMDDPDDVQAVNFLQKELGDKLRLYIATSENILVLPAKL